MKRIRLLTLAMVMLLSAFSIPVASAAAAIEAVYKNGTVEAAGSGFANGESYTVRVVNAEEGYIKAMAQASTGANGEWSASVVTGKLDNLDDYHVYVNREDGTLAAKTEAIVEDGGAVDYYSVSYSGNGHTGGAVPTDPGKYKAGDEVILLGNTNGLVKAGYSFAGWTADKTVNGQVYQAGSKLTMEERDLVLYAVWNLASGGSGWISLPQENGKENIVRTDTDGTVTASITLKGKIEAGSAKWSATLPADTGAAMLEMLLEAEKAGSKAVLEIKAEAGAAAEASYVELIVPSQLLEQISNETEAAVQLDTGIGRLYLNTGALAQLAAEADAGEVSFAIHKLAEELLPAGTGLAAGDGPVYEIVLKAGGKTITHLGAERIGISFPYTFKLGEDLNAIIVYEIASESGKSRIAAGAYSPDKAAVSIRTSSLSWYAVAHNKVVFQDVDSSHWFERAVTFIAARGITDGTDENSFSPEQTLTRGQFLVMLMRACQLDPLTGAADNFADAGHTYYTDYLAAAKELGIAEGIGANLFAPEQQITRQEMFTLLYKSLQAIHDLPEAAAEQQLSDFTDEEQIAPWAREAMAHLVEAGIVSGSGNDLLQPQLTATRAEMAQLLYNLLKP